MSLINDALKRAGNAKPPLASPATQLESPLPPVDYRRPSVWQRLLVPALGLVLALAGWLFVKGWRAETNGSPSPHRVRVLAREPEPASYPRDIKSGTEAVSAPNPRAVLANLSIADAPTPVTNLQVLIAAPAKPTFPVVRLQGIFYRPKNPSVMINGKTVLIGGKAGSAKVIAITRDSVTLEWNGETKVLTLE